MQSHVSQPSNLPFGGSSQLQFQPQAPPPPLAPHQLRQIPQQAQQQSQLRVQNSSNIPIGLWSNPYKQPPAQSNMNSLFNTTMLNKQPLFDTTPTYNQVLKKNCLPFASSIYTVMSFTFCTILKMGYSNCVNAWWGYSVRNFLRDNLRRSVASKRESSIRLNCMKVNFLQP